MGVWQHDRVEIIPNEQGNRTTPSYVAFTDTERLIGDAAKNQVGGGVVVGAVVWVCRSGGACMFGGSCGWQLAVCLLLASHLFAAG